ncbi:hypothetical protein BT96DRAFT_830697 [Gymnopus androsaceus JB14]|uniref:DDE Tnp4 domain-containing protein n=1 Tax=Gymnopus androsaceus JB14 TaxID=1447944 RepID=A0A6A4H2U5_9AGAR|nr:hypothetical protein BT96DRAFT_830697 [Gymnopus androsaceus JB14]
MDLDDIEQQPTARRWVKEEIQEMYTHRYEAPRDRLPRPSQSYLHHVLITLKNGHADYFRQELRVTPYTFDKLVAAIENDPVFENSSEAAHQAPVEEQLAVLLYRFGHDGNAASVQGVCNWAGIGKGTVLLYTKRVLTALLRPEFMQDAVQMPNKDEKEEAKKWVERHSCKAWRNGWCFVDGTLIPLYTRPYWYGESYFDRKCRYSLNIQIVNLPNLRIIDFGYGHTGSTHDATAWEGTRIATNHEDLLEEGEWIWADSAYPVLYRGFIRLL